MELEYTIEELTEVIRRRSRSYTPEWRFDEDDPDIGAALALVYAGMQDAVSKRLALLPLKNQIAFFNELNAEYLPAVPASGYVSFSLVSSEVEGSEIERGMAVFADAPAEDISQVRYETEDDIYVSPASVAEIYQVCDELDLISRPYVMEEDAAASKPKAPTVLFGLNAKNLQEHCLYFSHDLLMDVASDAYIELACDSHDDIAIDDVFLQRLADGRKAEFTYYSEDGWIPFAKLSVRGGGLLFHKTAEQPAFAKYELMEEGEEHFWIRCVIHCFRDFAKLQIATVKLSGWNDGQLPDTVNGGGEECDLHEFLAFGERLEMYGEVYFGSEEVLGKKGAQVTLGFGMDFIQIPLDETEESINWEWIMRRSDFKPNLEFDVTIERVVWEYYNGHGWTGLFPERQYGQVFSVAQGTIGQYKKLQFTCPEDIERTLINAKETYYIRARILKINNLYKTKGNYILPLLSNVTFTYQFFERKVPQLVVLENNLERRQFVGSELFCGQPLYPFFQTGQSGMGLYLAFAVAPVGNPVKILFCMGDRTDLRDNSLVWEYWNGSQFCSLNLVDETENFSRTGIVTFVGRPDFAPRQMFGIEAYWIRVEDTGGAYLDADCTMRPVLNSIHMNTVKAKNVTMRRQEYFQAEIYEEGMAFPLLEGNIYEIEVYVDEQGHLRSEEEQRLKREMRIEQEFDAAGLPVRTWVKWERVEDFINSRPQDRHYVLEALEGNVRFGNGRRGRVPCNTGTDNIRVSYLSGGGGYTNVAAGGIERMDMSPGFIRGVENPLPMSGGSDSETLEAALIRNSAKLRHQNRAVCERDFEELAMLSSRSIERVKCFSGYDREGEPLQGAVTLVVLLANAGGGEQEEEFRKTRQQIYEYLRDRISTTLADSGRFFVTTPMFVEIRLYIELSVRDFNQVFSVKRQVQECLQKFLSPQKWEFGTLPNTMQIQNEINEVPGVVYIRKVLMNVYMNSMDGWREADIEEVAGKRYALPLNGPHEIVINVLP